MGAGHEPRIADRPTQLAGSGAARRTPIRVSPLSLRPDRRNLRPRQAPDALHRLQPEQTASNLCSARRQVGSDLIDEQSHSLVAKAASKDASDGRMPFMLRMKSRASGAPSSRSMPASSHSIEIGPA